MNKIKIVDGIPCIVLPKGVISFEEDYIEFFFIEFEFGGE